MPNDTEQFYYGAVIGQKGSSARSELAGWIFNLTLPYRHQYATDSAALIAKANKIIAAAEAPAPCRPFKKAWRLQRDGDLWTLAWDAVYTRGTGNHSLRKVKGHADQEDIEQSRSNRFDKTGNDQSDTLADEGVASHNGQGLVRLAAWLANRHTRYCSFVKRIHKIIVAVTFAETKRKNKT